MGCDHLVCKKCCVGYDLERGTVFWVWDFIAEHWHKKQERPLKHSYFTVKFKDLPKHFTIKHRMPTGYISVREPSKCFRKIWLSFGCYHKDCLLKYINWIEKQKKIGKWKKKGYSEETHLF
jgi:hypothetical protein